MIPAEITTTAEEKQTIVSLDERYIIEAKNARRDGRIHIIDTRTNKSVAAVSNSEIAHTALCAFNRAESARRKAVA